MGAKKTIDKNKLMNNFINILGWMICKLNLKSNELLIFAAIYGFSQDGESMFNGSHTYLAEFINISRATVIRTLEELIKKDLILKEKDNQYCTYKVNFAKINELVYGIKIETKNEEESCSKMQQELLQNDTPTCSKMQQGLLQNDTVTCSKMQHNNKYIYKEIYKSNGDTPQKEFLGEFKNVKLTEEQYQKLKDRNLLNYIDRLSGYLESTGRKYKSHYATILNWARKDNPNIDKVEDGKKESIKAPSLKELGDYIT